MHSNEWNLETIWKLIRIYAVFHNDAFNWTIYHLKRFDEQFKALVTKDLISKFYGQTKQRMNGIDLFLLIIKFILKRLYCIWMAVNWNDAVISPCKWSKRPTTKLCSICFVWWCDLSHLAVKRMTLAFKEFAHTLQKTAPGDPLNG